MYVLLTLIVASAIPPGGLAGGIHVIYEEHEYSMSSIPLHSNVYA